MALTNNDLKKIKTVVKEEIKVGIADSEKRMTGKIKKIVELENGELAVMTKHGFDEQTNNIKIIRQELAVHDFKMTEMTHKSDHFHLKERVGIIEEKIGLEGK